MKKYFCTDRFNLLNVFIGRLLLIKQGKCHRQLFSGGYQKSCNQSNNSADRNIVVSLKLPNVSGK